MNTPENQFNLDNPYMSENLFIEKEAPVASNETTSTTDSKLAQFLNINFKSRGYTDGYRYHSVDVMDNSMRIIRSEFREIADTMIDDLNLMNSKLHKHLVDVKHLSAKAQEKVANRIEEVSQSILRLQQEKEYSSADEGLVTKCLHLYRDGFMRGLEDYNEEILVMSYSGLFK
jgi:hypothetical protein